MGRKSRLKRQRKKKQAKTNAGKQYQKVDTYFSKVILQLREVLAQYLAEEVVLASSVSELWLPNITSQVKHQLLLRVAVSMPPSEYSGARHLDSYEAFHEFLREVSPILPSFPTLEDYVPELDWGEVSFDVGGTFIPVMYGGSVERVTDFATAFRIVQAANSSALLDMDIALWMQSYLISHVQTQSTVRSLDVELGHMEVPPRDFWESCREALLSVCKEVTRTLGETSKGLTIDLGHLRMPDSSVEFGNSILEGSSLPALIVRVNETLLPLSPRNAVGVVIEGWSNRVLGTQIEQLSRTARAMSDFLSDRFRSGEFVTGPFVPGNRDRMLPYFISAAVVCDEKLYLIAPGNIDDPPTLTHMCRSVRALVSSGTEWGLRHLGRNTGVQILRQDGKMFQATDVVFLIVPTSVTTQARRVPNVGAGSQLIPLSDFISVFDVLEDVQELGKFLSYVDAHSGIVWSPLIGLTDLFGSFRDSYGLLIDGAIQPNMIGLDPHWGSNWRFKQLADFWASAPTDFPNGRSTWAVDGGKKENLYRLLSKGSPALSWSTYIGPCAVHVVFPFIPARLDTTNGNLLETFVHCTADALSEREEIIAALPIFRRPRIVLVCRPDRDSLVEEDTHQLASGAYDKPLLNRLDVIREDDEGRIMLGVEVNLSKVHAGILNAIDALFETECAIEFLRSVAVVANQELPSEVIDEIESTSTRRPRFVMHQMYRDVDVPDVVRPSLPQLSDYKLARRDLAVVFRDINAQPGRYELSKAKAIIDLARDAYRSLVHRRISSCDLYSLLVFSIEQHDALIAEYHHDTKRVKMSLAHEVDYSRDKAIADAYDNFTRNARNYRYLIEAALSLAVISESTGREQVTVDLVAAVDWLFVLYGASDVLHNGVHPAGVELDHNFVPEVFFYGDLKARESEFSLEQAQLKLGLDVLPQDEVHGLGPGQDLTTVDHAFHADLGFTLTHLAQCLLTLARWVSATGSGGLKLSYQASEAAIVATLCQTVEGLVGEEARRIVDFLTIDPPRIRQLLGKEGLESDVPVWEHNKRAQRLTIRPLVPLANGNLMWGAGSAERAGRIWTGTVSDGYLPADFDWPTVKTEVRKIKKGIEGELERRAYEICGRISPHVEQNVDFMRRFKKENFDDVGDFDVLAYWPESNQWLAVECKYNQPPFCLKDARRLRDRIFGSGQDRGQFQMIERRRWFLGEHSGRLRELLGWPPPTSAQPPSIMDVYVSREIYWWMRNPPYDVKAEFVRIDAFDGWLRHKELHARALASLSNP